LPPYYSNIGKRYVKTPKLYFYDTGLLCSLLGFTHINEITMHQMRGHIFETAVISEIAKKYFNSGQKPRLYFWRDSDNMEKEIDLLEETLHGLELTEIKSSQTANRDYSKNLIRFNVPQSHKIKSRQVIYDGKDMQFSFEEQFSVHYKNWKSLMENNI